MQWIDCRVWICLDHMIIMNLVAFNLAFQLVFSPETRVEKDTEATRLQCYADDDGSPLDSFGSPLSRSPKDSDALLESN